MKIDAMLTRLANDGDVALHWATAPDQGYKKWSIATIINNSLHRCEGDNLKQTVTAAYEERYGKELNAA